MFTIELDKSYGVHFYIISVIFNKPSNLTEMMPVIIVYGTMSSGHYTRDDLVPGICCLINPSAMEIRRHLPPECSLGTQLQLV